MAAPVTFIPLAAGLPEEGAAAEILCQVFQNVEFVTDVASVLGTAEQTVAPPAEGVNIVAAIDTPGPVKKKLRRNKWKTDPDQQDGDQTVFCQRLPRKIDMTLDEDQQLTLIPVTSGKEKRRSLCMEGQNTLIDIVRSLNPFCVFALKQNRVKAQGSRKHASPFFLGSLTCSFHDCPVKVKLKIQDEARQSIEIQFEGQVTHSSNETFGLKSPSGRQRQPKKLTTSESTQGDSVASEITRRQLLKNELDRGTIAIQEDSSQANAKTPEKQDSQSQRKTCSQGETSQTNGEVPAQNDSETEKEVCLQEENTGEEGGEAAPVGRFEGGMFHCKLPETCTAVILEEKKPSLAPVMTKSGRRRLTRDGQKTLIEAVTRMNPFCVFAVEENRVKAEESRKRNCVFFRGRLRCTFPNCPVKAFVVIRKDISQSMEIAFKGEVIHKSNYPFGVA